MVEKQTKTRVWEDSSLCPETSTENAVEEFHLREGILQQHFQSRFLGLNLKMEISYISLTKVSSLFLHAVQSPFYWRILKKTILFSGFKNPYEKIRVESIHE